MRCRFAITAVAFSLGVHNLGMALAQNERVVNVYNWSDYIDMENVKAFVKKYGIKVNYDTYDGDETLEAKLLTGHTGYDVVFPSSNYFARGIRTGEAR